ncbi:MAG: hypothetical protein AB7T10_05535 [bacterium]
MIGLYGCYSKQIQIAQDFAQFSNDHLKINEMKNMGRGFAGRNTLNQFLNDKVFFEDEEFMIGCEGIVFNSNVLKKQSSVNSMFELIKKNFKTSVKSFPSSMHGNFSGFVYDKSSDRITLFTCQNGAKQMFYYLSKEKSILLFANTVEAVAEMMRKNGISVKLDENGANCMLSIGYMIGDVTLIEGVGKIEPGTILSYDGNNIIEEKYFKISSYPVIQKSEDAIIEELDNLYIQAIKAEYEKDLEYSYRHISTLSGGLDSRMNVLNAHRLGFKDFLSICFSENNYLDETISKKIAADMKDEYMFYSLNNGTYLRDIESSSRANDSLVFYSGSSYMYSMISRLNLKGYGLMHTGVAGNEVLYTSLQFPYHDKPTPERLKIIFYSTKLYERAIPMLRPLCEKYETMEQMAFYEKCVNGMYNAFMQIQQFTEFASPSIHPLPLEYIMRIDPKLKFNAGIYVKWALKKTPHVNDYRWEHIAGAKLSSTKAEIFARKAGKRIATMFLGYRPSKNPWEKWMKRNNVLMTELDNYYNTNLHLIDKGIKSDAEYLYKKGTLKEKTQVLTLLSGVKHLIK